MNQDPRVIDFLRALAIGAAVALLAMLLFTTNAGATQPQCTGDRHYDGVGCCLPQAECPDPVECPQPEECEPVLPCPEVPACPPVTCEATCEDGDDGKAAPPVIVQVDRCPEAEVLEVCKVRGNGVVVCSRAKRKGEGRTGSRKILVPRSIIDQIADRQRNY